MPLEVIESTDPLASLMHFQTSSVYELILSLQVLLKPERRTAWVRRAREALPREFMDELDALYEPFFRGSMFFELAVDYPDHDDVPGFIDYVRAMDPASFIFYVSGRILPQADLAATGLKPEAVRDALLHSPYYDRCMCLEAPLDTILDDVPAFQGRLAELWAWYWDAFFAAEVESLRVHGERALQDKQHLLARSGGQAVWEHVTGKPALLPPLPDDHPVQSIVFIPVYLIAAPVYVFYGYGKIVVIFDSERTEARSVEIELSKERSLTVFKALSDGSRLDILRIIAYAEGELSGKQLAAKTGLSASAVSRHLAQLRDADLIVEEASDSRTLTYRLQRDTLGNLSEQLFSFLSS